MPTAPLKCSCCGQPVTAAEFLCDLSKNTASRWGRTVKLRPQMAELLEALRRKYPDPVPVDECLVALHGAYDVPEGSDHQLGVLISSLRRAIQPLGVVVRNVHRRGWRLWMADAPIVDAIRPRRAWTEAEDAAVRSGGTHVQIARQIGRSPDAVKIRAHILRKRARVAG